MKQTKNCLSCNSVLTNDIGSTTFMCPNCSKVEIVRCRSCRENAVKYKCPECGFIGPN